MNAQEYQQFQEQQKEANRQFAEILKNALVEEKPSFIKGNFKFKYSWDEERNTYYIEVYRTNRSGMLLRMEYRSPRKQDKYGFYELILENSIYFEPYSEFELFKILYLFIKGFHISDEPMEIYEREYSNNWGYQIRKIGMYDVIQYCKYFSSISKKVNWNGKLEVRNFLFSFPIK